MYLSPRDTDGLPIFLGLAVLLFGVACAPQDAAQTRASDAMEPVADQAAPQGEHAVVTILTTNGADFLGSMNPLQGEWSFAAWVEIGGRSFLFDTGWSPDNVLSNAEVLGIDLSAAEDLILSHNHMTTPAGSRP